MPLHRSSVPKPRVAVIGGGIFGATAAMVLAPQCEVNLFERAASLFTGATFANHGRQHFGFHYPRSPETAHQCLESHEAFRSFYRDAEVSDFPNYYCVARENSKLNADQYLAFCTKTGLQHETESPPVGTVDRNKIELSLRVVEGVLDFATLKRAALNRLQELGTVRVHLNHEARSGAILTSGLKELVVTTEGSDRKETFDFVINATYAHHNTFCGWFGFHPRMFQYNLQELAVIRLPPSARAGITIMDGPFPSVIPMGRSPFHLLAHVNASQLVRESSQNIRPLLSRVSAIESNWSEILKASAEYLPFLQQAEYIRSLFVDRVVDAGASLTDARLTDITDHGHGCFSIFAAKVITCVSTAHKLADMIAPT